MLTTLNKRLFEDVLVAPALASEVDRLQIVSGYASASMVSQHKEQLVARFKAANLAGKRIRLELLVGMIAKDGLHEAQHKGFQDLASKDDGVLDLACSYVTKKPPVHAKTYCWFKGDSPVKAFTGSANYTITGFSNEQYEFMYETEPSMVKPVFGNLLKSGVDCLDLSAKELLLINNSFSLDAARPKISQETMSLLVKGKETPGRSGINWGQRDKRDKDQAYLSVPVAVQKSGFFPPRGRHFIVKTDDGISMIMVRAQDQGKALHTTESNSILGRYIRSRLGVPSGAYVTRADFERYGRSDITFSKLDDETFELDFSVGGNRK